MADFQGFTAFTEKHDAEEVHEYVTQCWKQLAPYITGNGGLVEKYIGDAIVASFGVGQAREEDPIRAVRAALGIQARLRQMAAAGTQPVLPMRIGIHTGRAVVETDSTGVNMFGDTYPVADRLQKVAPAGGVLISHDTYRHLKGLFDVQPPRLETLTGRADPVRAYVVLRARPRLRRRQERGVEGVEAPMVGRDAELELLQSTLDAAMERRQPHLVTIIGDPGLGKSRLLDEFLKRLESVSDPVNLFCARATPEISGAPFALLRDLLAARFDIQDGDSAASAKEKLQTGVDGLLAEQPADSGEMPPEGVAHFLGHLAGLDYSASPHLQGMADSPEQFRARAFQAAMRFFRAAGAAPKSTRSAAVLVAEDVHWSDEGSLELIAHLASASAGAPLMIICLARPEFLERRPAWGRELPGHASIRLQPLAGDASCALVKNILSQARNIPPELLGRVIGDAEGNPFYIEEIIKMLLEQGVIQAGADSWKIELTGAAGAAVPATLTGVLQARLDALQPEERKLVQQAPVLGRVFSEAAVEHLGTPEERGERETDVDRPLEQSRTADALAGLCRKQIIFRQETSFPGGAIEYSFSHDLLRNVAYERLLKKSRQRLHQRAAFWLIRQGGERVNEVASVVAGHFEKGGRMLEAADWNGRAGHQAFAGHLAAAAVEFFRKALDLSQGGQAAEATHTKCLGWFDGLAESLAAQAKFPEAREAYVGMRTLAEKNPDIVAQARSCNGLAFLHERQGSNRASIEAADQAIALCQQAGVAGRGEKFRALYFKGWAYYRLADAGQVLGLADQCREVCSELGDRAGMSRTFKLYGVAHLQLGHYDEADRFFQQGLEIWQQSGDLVTVAAMWSNRAETARARGDYESAVSLYQTALDLTRKIGWRDSERIYLCNLSAARLGLRQFAQAESDLRKVIAEAAPAGAWNLPEALGLLSEACLEQGKTGEALESAQRALELARSSGNSLFAADAWRAVGRAVAAGSRGESDCVHGHQAADATAGPDQCFQESLNVYRQIQARGEEARTLRIWAEFDLTKNRISAGLAKLEQARRIFEELGMASEIEKVNVLLGNLATPASDAPD